MALMQHQTSANYYLSITSSASRSSSHPCLTTMKASFFIILGLVVLALAGPLTREQVDCARKDFDRNYTTTDPYSNYITASAVQEDNGEFVIFVTLWQQPPAELELTFPQTYRGVKVIYHLEPVCTQEARICPDGSYVGRVGPKCEFAPCPSLTRLVVFVLSLTIFAAVSISLCIYCCVAIVRRRRCVEAQHEQATVVPQAQTQPIYYYAPSSQAPVVNQAPYSAYVAFQPMSDEEYARQLQAQFNNDH